MQATTDAALMPAITQKPTAKPLVAACAGGCPDASSVFVCVNATVASSSPDCQLRLLVELDPYGGLVHPSLANSFEKLWILEVLVSGLQVREPMHDEHVLGISFGLEDGFVEDAAG